MNRAWNDPHVILSAQHLLSCTQWAAPEVINHPQYEHDRKRELAERLAQAVGDRCTTRTQHGASVVYRTECYVIPPDVFWLLVRMEAERMAKDGWTPSKDADAALSRAQVKHLISALKCIRSVDQGAGGNLSFKEMAESAMRQANLAIENLAEVAVPHTSRVDQPL